MRRFFNLTIAMFVTASIGIAGLGLAGQTTKTASKKAEPKKAAVKNPIAPTSASIAAGQALYQKYCRFCHGADAKGDGPQAPKDTHPPNLMDDTWDHGSTDADLFASIKEGIGPKFDMKGYDSKLMPQDMWNLVNYIRSIGPKGTPR